MIDERPESASTKENVRGAEETSHFSPQCRHIITENNKINNDMNFKINFQ